jgi:hypothetical protein
MSWLRSGSLCSVGRRPSADRAGSDAGRSRGARKRKSRRNGGDAATECLKAADTAASKLSEVHCYSTAP